MKLAIGTLSDMEKIDGPAVVVGSAPSVRLFDFSSFSGPRIGVGDMPWRAPELGPYAYWVTANSEFPLPWLHNQRRVIKGLPVDTLVMATAAFGGLGQPEALSALQSLRLNSPFPVVMYDQRHKLGQMCEPPDGCCSVSQVIMGEEPIQSLLSADTPGSPSEYIGLHSVAFHGIALALLLGANPVYVAGIEFPNSRKNYSYFRPWKMSPSGSRIQTHKYRARRAIERSVGRLFRAPSVWTGHDEELISDLCALVETAELRGQTIINSSPTSLLSQVPGIESTPA